VAAGVTNIGQFFVALCDGAGNCGNSSNKARNYSASTATTAYSFNISPQADANGLFPNPTTVQANGPAGGSFTVTVNSGTPQTCTTTCTVTVTANGPNKVTITAPDGTTTVAAIPIDAEPPEVTVTTPAVNAKYQSGAVVPTSFACSGALTITGCAGPATLDTTTNGNHTARFVATDQFGLTDVVDVPYYVDGTPPSLAFTGTPPQITNAGSAVFDFSGTDPDDPAFPVTFTCRVDLAAAVPCTSPFTAAVPAPIDGPHVFTVVASDEVGNTTSQAFNWSIDTTGSVFQDFIGPADPTNQTSAMFAYTAVDPPDTAALRFGCTLDGVAVPCTSTGASVTGLTPRVAPYVFAVTATDPAGNATTKTWSWHVYADTTVTAQGIIRTLPVLKAQLTDAAGHPLAGQKLFLSRGRTGRGVAVPCRGANPDGSVTTAADGRATCNVTLTELLIDAFSGGFTASFRTTPPFLASSDSAGILS
jgi:hypothetical protein